MYRSTSKPKRRRNREGERFASELERARVASVIEHIRIALAGLLATVNSVSWFYMAALMPKPTGHFPVWSLLLIAVGLVMAFILGFYIMAVHLFMAPRLPIPRRNPGRMATATNHRWGCSQVPLN